MRSGKWTLLRSGTQKQGKKRLFNIVQRFKHYFLKTHMVAFTEMDIQILEIALTKDLELIIEIAQLIYVTES